MILSDYFRNILTVDYLIAEKMKQKYLNKKFIQNWLRIRREICKEQIEK